jgi:hypothetical protein
MTLTRSASLSRPLSEGEDFATKARTLAGYAGVVLHWSPNVFWATTPDELAAIFECLTGTQPASIDLDALMEMFPDG